MDDKIIKIGVLSDTHIPQKARTIPQVVLDGFKNVDIIIHAGDLTELSALQPLKKICKTVYAVTGNMDEAKTAELLPRKLIISVKKFTIGIMHGSGAPVNLINLLKNEFKNDACDLIIFGHSHQPLNEKIGKTIFFNPGSVTDKTFAPFNSYGIIRITDKITAEVVKI